MVSNRPLESQGPIDMKLPGGCLCGGVRYEVDGPLAEASHCHCSMCRRFHGAAFATYVSVEVEKFHWLRGEDLVCVYESNPGAGWAFCRVCGSSLGLPRGGKLASLAVGCLDDDPGTRPAYHMFVGSKAPWYEITDALPQFMERPPEGDMTIIGTNPDVQRQR